MKIQFENYLVDTSSPIDIAIPLKFTEEQPEVHGVAKATAKILTNDYCVGSVAKGGSCNWEQYTLIPHSNGTHTECIGHITKELIPIHTILKELLLPMALITISPELSSQTHETYFPEKKQDEMLITKKNLEDKLSKIPDIFCRAVAIRTLPNDSAKITRNYLNDAPPYFSREAVEYLNHRAVDHLLVDIPSIDRWEDKGHMMNHRLFWNVPDGVKTAGNDAKIHKTITEFIYVPNDVSDGLYALNLQIPCFAADAAPSRPLIFRIMAR